MSLTHIEYGSLASSSVMNDNFDYLDNRITTVANNLISNSSGIYSSLSSLNSSISEQTADLASDIEDLAEEIGDIKSIIESHNTAPDYNRGIAITMPYTVEEDGYVYAGADTQNTARYVFVNEKPVHCHHGFSASTSNTIYSASVFRVSAGDVVSVNKESGLYYFYPMKGESVCITE